jgi:uncharacterized membrane protein (UPF0127 family)
MEQVAGLMMRLHIPNDYAMVYDMKKEEPIQIHTCFCFFAIDAVFLDSDRRVVQMLCNIRPWKLFIKPSRPARYFIETLAGEARKKNIHIGDLVVF